MVSAFLKNNFKSLNEEEKKKAEMKAKIEQSSNQLRKNIVKGSMGEAEAAILADSVPSDILKIKKLLEEENK